jgi:hypothetical protein
MTPADLVPDIVPLMSDLDVVHGRTVRTQRTSESHAGRCERLSRASIQAFAVATIRSRTPRGSARRGAWLGSTRARRRRGGLRQGRHERPNGFAPQAEECAGVHARRQHLIALIRRFAVEGASGCQAFVRRLNEAGERMPNGKEPWDGPQYKRFAQQYGLPVRSRPGLWRAHRSVPHRTALDRLRAGIRLGRPAALRGVNAVSAGTRHQREHAVCGGVTDIHHPSPLWRLRPRHCVWGGYPKHLAHGFVSQNVVEWCNQRTPRRGVQPHELWAWQGSEYE